MSPPLVGIVHTAGSPCRCAEAIVRSLDVLGHRHRIVDAAAIETEARTLAADCDVVFDHTDTYLGHGRFRPLVRLLLEAEGACIAGSSAAASAGADDKVLAKSVMAAAGVPVPEGVVVLGPESVVPETLGPRFVVKSAGEHMSRGLSVVFGAEEARRAALALLESAHAPVLVERFIPGREFAVSVLDRPDGGEAEVLPILEWRLPEGPEGILGAARKLAVAEVRDGERPDAVPAALDPALLAAIAAHARRAFRALGLSGYARFDLRLSPERGPFFLECNPRPSLEPMEALSLSARWAGIDHAHLVERLIRLAQRRD